MVFSSSVFLFLFLPVTLVLYYGLPTRMRNSFLLVASLFFYAWGEVYYVYIIVISICFNYLFGRLIEERPQHGMFSRWQLLGLGVAVNLALLVYFKYINFILAAMNTAIGDSGIAVIEFEPVHLPLGISFFTFQAISYLVDVYRRETQAQRNFIDAALYIALFPQLIAGPIVRYRDIALQIRNRMTDTDLFISGMQRFIFGLAKKMLIANPLGELADEVFALGTGDITTGLAWLAILCYGLQIYFDFSAYSDMAIGLGRMFGFKFLENFNYPYISQSIQEFWRRWHISLSTWFRDYLYIPLGGNRNGAWRTYFNLSMVFVLCGLWHGANWNFLIWGMLHGCYLIIERLGFGRVLAGWWRPLRHAYVLLLVSVAWVFFRLDDVQQAWQFLGVMSGLARNSGADYSTAMYLTPYIYVTLGVAMLFSMPLYQWIRQAALLLSDRLPGYSGPVIVIGARYMVLATLLVISSAYIAAGTYNPFIYFRF